jgi:hypothetical protein
MPGLVPGDDHAHTPCFPAVANTASLAGVGLFPTILKGSTMNARFLRDEAARFRGMAEDAEREATKLRLLSMAADYEARAGVAKELTEPDLGETHGEVVEPTQDEPPKITLDRKVAPDLKETLVVKRRPVGRPRRE